MTTTITTLRASLLRRRVRALAPHTRTALSVDHEGRVEYLGTIEVAA